jgi:transcriptional regulator of acetoin/glycerol metabolism
VPPLRQRGEDIRELIMHFATEHRVALSSDLVDILLRHSWPGNVRELASTIVRLAAKSQGRRAGVHDMPSTIWYRTPCDTNLAFNGQKVSSGAVASVPMVGDSRWETVGDNRRLLESLPQVPIAQLEKLMVIKSMIANRGNVDAVAEELALSESTVRRRLTEIRLDPNLLQLLKEGKK